MSSVVANPFRNSRRSVFSWTGEHLFIVFVLVYGIWVGMPFLAPFFMHGGWDGMGKSMYLLYSFFCHQLPERSFFLFGHQATYSLREIQAVWQDTTDPWLLRQFIGNETLGWKVAWSDRMISFYTSVWLFAVIWYPFRNKVKSLPWWAFLLLLAPITFDGVTHVISDMAGIGQGFRDTNAWLVALTNNVFPTSL